MEEKKTLKPINWTKVLLYAVCITLVSFGIQTYRISKKNTTIEDQTSIINGLNDSAKVWKDKQGKLNVKTGVIVTSNPKDFIKIKNLEGQNKKLQDEVKNYEKEIKNGGSVTVFKTETKVKAVTTTKIIDTVFVPIQGEEKPMPVYTSDFNLNGWVIGNTVAKPDSTTVNMKIYDDFSVIIGEDKKGFLGLGTPVPFGLIKSSNPYTAIPESKTYKVQMPKKKGKWILPTAIGFVIGVAGTIYVTK